MTFVIYTFVSNSPTLTTVEVRWFKGAMSAGEHAHWGYANYFHLSKFYCFLAREIICHVQSAEI